MMDFTIFAQADAWIALLTLTVLEIVLGIDNIVFISINDHKNFVVIIAELDIGSGRGSVQYFKPRYIGEGYCIVAGWIIPHI